MFLVESNRLQELKREEREEERKVLVYLRTLLGRAFARRARSHGTAGPARCFAGQAQAGRPG